MIRLIFTLTVQLESYKLHKIWEKKQLILAKIQNIIYISPKQEIFDFESTWNEKETSISEKVPLVITS